jgi:hypothetical protein
VKAHEIFYGNKPFVINRPFVGDYLAEGHPLSKGYNAFKKSLFNNGEKVVYFADVVQKCSRKGQTHQRVLVVTEKAVHLVDDKNGYKSKTGARPLSDLASIDLTMKQDGLCVLHFSTSGDLILNFIPSAAAKTVVGERLAECVTAVVEAGAKSSRKVDVHFLDISQGIDATTLAGSVKIRTSKNESLPAGIANFEKRKNEFYAHLSEI